MALQCPKLAFENPVSAVSLPKEPLQSQWPVKGGPPKGYLFATTVGLLMVTATPMVLQNLFPWIYLAFVSAGFLFLWVFMLLLMFFLEVLRNLKHNPWIYLASFICAIALCLAPPEYSFLFLPLYLYRTVKGFRGHYTEFSSTTPLERSVAEQFRKDGTIPAAVIPVSIGKDFKDAVASWLGYNHTNYTFPGLWQSSAGSQKKRLAKTAFILLLLSVTVPQITLNLLREQSSDGGSPSLLATSLAHCLPILILLGACFLGSLSILGKAGGLRKCTNLPNQWNAFLQDLKQSPNPLERTSLYMGHVVADSSPIMNPLKTLGQHLWISGSTGSQKTTMLLFLIEQFIRQGYSVIGFDLKADSFELLNTLNKAAQSQVNPIDTWHFTNRHGWATQLCSPYGQSFWKNLSPSEKTDILLASMGLGFSRDYGESWYSDAGYTLLDFVNDKYPGISSFQELEEKITYEIAHARPDQLSNSVKRDGEHVSLIVRRISKVEMLNPSNHHPQSARDAALDFGRLFEKQGVAYWGLNSMISPTGSAEISRVMLATLLAAATSAQKRNHKVVLIIDEFQQMVAPGVLQLALRQARSLGITIILSNQTVADLKTNKNDFVPTVEGNTTTQMWMKGSGRDAIDQIQRLGGKYIDELKSRTTTSDGRSSVTRQEVIVDRFDATTIAKVSSDIGSFMMRITSNDGYAQYNGIPFIARADYHLSLAEYQRRVDAPWPALSPRSVLVGQNSSPLPPTSPSSVPAPNPPSRPPTRRTKNVIGSGTLGHP